MVAALNGAPREALEHEELMRLMLPILRADLRIAETCSFEPNRHLDVPVTLLAGEADPLAPPQEMAKWDAFFAGPIEHRSYPGDRFYLLAETADLLTDLRWTLSRATRDDGSRPLVTSADGRGG